MIFTTRSQATKQTGFGYLGNTNSSSKIMKGKKKKVDTFVLYLAPADLSGWNVCPKASADCKASCLHNSGHNRMNAKLGVIDASRIGKTALYFQHRTFFAKWIVAEIAVKKAKAEAKGYGFAVRLNGTSDINFETLKLNGKNIFEIFPDVQFYDYTKVANRSKLLKYKNYDLTFSYSGYNWNECESAMANGMRVAVVFEKVPAFYKGIEVINGDDTDLRYMDATDVIVGLKFKQVRHKVDFTQQKFVIQENDTDCTY